MNIMLDVHMHLMHSADMKLNQYLLNSDDTDATFGSRVGLSQSQVSRIRRGLSKPSWNAIERIAVETKGAVSAADWFEPTPASFAKNLGTTA